MILLVPSAIGIVLAYFYSKYFGTFANPVSFFSVGVSLPVFITYILTFSVQDASSLNVNIIDMHGKSFNYLAIGYSLSFFVFLLPWLILPLRNNFAKVSNLGGSVNIGALTLVMLILIISIAFAISFLGGVPIIQMITGVLDIREYNEMIKQLPFGLLSIINVFTIVLIILAMPILLPVQKNRYSTLFYKVTIVFFILILCVWQGKRQNFLIFFFFLFSRYYICWGIPNFRIGKIGPKLITFTLLLIMLSIFVIVDLVRYQGEGFNYYSIFGYLVWPVFNMLSIVELKDLGVSLSQIITFTELIPARFGGKDNLAELGPYLHEPTSPGGYMAYWWVDGGIMFAMFGVFLLSLFSRILYNRLNKIKSEKNLGLYLLVLWCCVTSGIYTHFISLNYFWLPYLVVWFLASFNLRSTAKGI